MTLPSIKKWVESSSLDSRKITASSVAHEENLMWIILH